MKKAPCCATLATPENVRNGHTTKHGGRYVVLPLDGNCEDLTDTPEDMFFNSLIQASAMSRVVEGKVCTVRH
jgi:DNA gyrase inhibitor GyrI